MEKKVTSGFISSLLLTSLLTFSGPTQAGPAWEAYKLRFLNTDGRIIDTGNNNISHTEGQGFAMMMAVANNDRASFDSMWNWTRTHLQDPKSGLFYWRYDPGAEDPIADKNNATDGDMFIGWALLKAGERWKEKKYIQASDNITHALLKHATRRYAGKQVMLPGSAGFEHKNFITLNPSYFIFPAWEDFARRSYLRTWRELIADGKALLENMRWGQSKLPTDWIRLTPSAQVSPAPEWPARFSYDAIRIPLYIKWQDSASPLLVPWRTWWGAFPREATPAWVNVVSNERAPYSMKGGLLAVRDFTMGYRIGEPTIETSDDYYSASLKMLVWLAESSIKDRK